MLGLQMLLMAVAAAIKNMSASVNKPRVKGNYEVTNVYLHLIYCPRLNSEHLYINVKL